MDGSEVFKVAVRNLTSCLDARDERAAGIHPARSLDWVVAASSEPADHQPKVSDRLGFPLEKFILNIEEYGKHSSA